MHNLNIGIVADWLVTYAGSEKVIKEFLEVFPESELYSIVDFLFSFHVDYLFHPNFGLGVNLGYFLGTFSKVKITNGISTQEQTLDKNSRYNASNFHVSVGLHYYLNK